MSWTSFKKLLTIYLNNFMYAFHRKNCSFNRKNNFKIYFWPTQLTKCPFTDSNLNENTPFQVPYPSTTCFCSNYIFNLLQQGNGLGF